jgi:hypothetical protein
MQTRDPGYLNFTKEETGIPHLRRTAPLRCALRRVRDSRHCEKRIGRAKAARCVRRGSPLRDRRSGSRSRAREPEELPFQVGVIAH